MLVALVPLFDENMAVSAYSVFTQKHNYLLNPYMLGTGKHDGAAQVEGLELIRSIGIESLSDDKEIFVPVTNISILADLEGQCDAPSERIVFLIDDTIPPVEMYINRLKQLKDEGFKLGIHKLAVSQFEDYREILLLMDYVLLNSQKIAIDKAKIYFGKLYPNIKLCAGNIDNMESFEELKATGGYTLYEGNFYRVPVTRGNNQVSPLKLNYIELLNIVNADDFDLQKAADIIGRDTALTISLLGMVNRMTISSGITSMRHAAAMLGQNELKRWINTAVAGKMSADKPSEITRLSLIRGRFAENLASGFNLAVKKDELFLMGLFSVLDVILEKPMNEALEYMHVTGEIEKALTKREGILAPVFDFMLQYEAADWQEVSRQMVLGNMTMEFVHQAYTNALEWYKELIVEN